LALHGKGTIDEFRNGKFPRLKPGVAGVGGRGEEGGKGFARESGSGWIERGNQREREREREKERGGEGDGWRVGAKGVDRGSRWLVSEDEINSAVGFIAPRRKRAVEKGQM